MPNPMTNLKAQLSNTCVENIVAIPVFIVVCIFQRHGVETPGQSEIFLPKNAAPYNRTCRASSSVFVRVAGL